MTSSFSHVHKNSNALKMKSKYWKQLGSSGFWHIPTLPTAPPTTWASNIASLPLAHQKPSVDTHTTTTKLYQYNMVKMNVHYMVAVFLVSRGCGPGNRLRDETRVDLGDVTKFKCIKQAVLLQLRFLLTFIITRLYNTWLNLKTYPTYVYHQYARLHD